ncbi:MAG: ATP-dependent RecD-like DNA helicase [Deltaproteobacteria bacterium]|nr:ATP-dependent RecD-like DNA helicase [Deltaproteobacteria bacterium]
MTSTFPEPSDHHDLATLTGQVERISYTHPVSHFTVARLKSRDRPDLVTVVGRLTGIQAGEQVRLKGRWVFHPRFGEQFQVVWWTSVVPATATGIQKYLASGFIHGIGPELARRLVKHFGDQTLEVIDNAPQRLQEVEGIGSKRAAQIQAAWETQKDIREVMLFLQEHGVGVAYATKIYKQYGSQAIQVVSANPYQLATDVYGIGFLTADRLAARLNIDRQSPLRLAAGLIYTLDQLALQGHVYAPRQLLIDKAQELLEAEAPPLEAALESQAQTGHLVIESWEGGEERIYRRPFFVAETGIAHLLARLQQGPGLERPLALDQALEWAQNRRRLELSAEQAQAVTSALTEKVLVITGGPGTGKTTIISCIRDIYRSLGARVTLLAPTGRAAKRLSEATGGEASTIHRCLEFSPQTGGFRHNAAQPLKTDVVIVDEVSMVDTILMYHLLKALPVAARVILVGDAHQLPSVGPGNVLKDLIDSRVIPVAQLREIYRQARQSLIVINAHRINQGQLPIFPCQSQHADFFFLEIDDPEVLRDRLLEVVVKRLPRQYGFDPVKDIQVLTPMHRGVVGVQNLNQELQKQLNRIAPAWERGGRTFKLHDKVMQLRNNYDKEVFNGDIGRVSGFDAVNNLLRVDFEGREVVYEPAEWDEITLAYAISIHKAQGNEFPAVAIALTTQHYLMLQRNLLYTAVTRGKQLVILLGSKKALSMAIRNDRPLKRYSGLAARLRQSLTGPV